MKFCVELLLVLLGLSLIEANSVKRQQRVNKIEVRNKAAKDDEDCQDKSNGQQTSECADRKGYCDFEPYKKFMEKECPTTCETPKCKNAANAAKPNAAKPGAKLPPSKPGAKLPPSKPGAKVPPSKPGAKVPPSKPGAKVPPQGGG